jgi:hypothetical protein
LALADLRPYEPGQSGNPIGKTRAMRRMDELLADFERVYGRPATDGERIQIRTAAVLAARLEKGNPKSRDLVKVANSLDRALRRLGLDRRPPPPAPPAAIRAKRVVEEVKEAVAAAGPAERVLSRLEEARKQRMSRQSEARSRPRRPG